MGFLDRSPFDNSDPAGLALLEALLAVYDRDTAVYRLVQASGLRPADFRWSAPMSQVWPEILQKAADQRLLRRLIMVVAQDQDSAAYDVIARLVAQPLGEEGLRSSAGQGPVADNVPRPTYLEQVRRIAPPRLVGRAGELDELARFCVEPDRGPYMWWQAEPWAGKSALLSTFVLNPPGGVRRRVRIVSFFIAARLAAQDTREAFIQSLLEQLSGLLGQFLPPVLPEETREAFLLDLMSQAAAACARGGKRLVLVVDGLDEDRSVTTGPDAHSIAGLLPRDPPHGMRVIVAGRPNPPVPDDVPGWHPLRDGRIIRPLAASPHAQDIGRLAGIELKRLLHGSSAEQDVLGLLTAARGGLSVLDLAELADIPLWEAERILHAAAGRTFTRRASRWNPISSPETYLLGHEELQAAAGVYLGRGRLGAFVGRLNAWADAWRARGWPPGTPEYLLDGYYRLLVLEKDMPGLIACAGDLARQDRLLAVTGGDTAALAEIRTAIDAIAAQDAPDVAAALSLACQRDLLSDRNSAIPPSLPAAWGALGRAARAEALAAAIADPSQRVDALAQTAEALAQAGQREQAAGIADQAKALALSVTNPRARVDALAQVARALAATGQRKQATEITGKAYNLAYSFENPNWQADALGSVAEALAAVGRHKQAKHLPLKEPGYPPYKESDYPHLQAVLRARMARALAGAGKLKDAARVAVQAEALARSLTDRSDQASALAQAAEALAAARQFEQAAGAAEDAAALARSDKDLYWRESGLVQVVGALAAAGQFGRAEAVAHSMAGSGWQADALARLADALAAAGRFEQAEALASSLTNPKQQVDAWARLAKTLAKAGHFEHASMVAEQAESAARSIADPEQQVYTLVRLAKALAKVRQFEQATRVAEQAEPVARSITGSHSQDNALTQVAYALAAAGRFEQAEALAGSLTDPEHQATALVEVTEALAAAGQFDRAVTVAGQAESAARCITGMGAGDSRAVILERIAPTLVAAGRSGRAVRLARSVKGMGQPGDALAQVAEALVAAGRSGRAETLARSIPGDNQPSKALAQVAEALAAAGQLEEGARIAVEAEALAGIIADKYWRDDALSRVAAALAATGQYERAEAAIDSMPWPQTQARALVPIARILSEAGRLEQAAKAATRAEDLARTIQPPNARALVQVRIAEALAGAGEYQQAETLARSITCKGDVVTIVDVNATAFGQIAETLARSGDLYRARKAAVASCTMGSWESSLASMLTLDTTAFTSVAYVLDHRWHLNLSL